MCSGSEHYTQQLIIEYLRRLSRTTRTLGFTTDESAEGTGPVGAKNVCSLRKKRLVSRSIFVGTAVYCRPSHKNEPHSKLGLTFRENSKLGSDSTTASVRVSDFFIRRCTSKSRRDVSIFFFFF